MSQATGIQAGSGLTELTLSVRQEGLPEQEVFLQHGLSIGRNQSNTICIDHPDVERIHAQVMRQSDGSMLLECMGEHMHLTMADGSKVQSLKLNPGTTFKLGKAVVRCLKRDTRPAVVVADNPWKVKCPRCHEVIVTLPHDTKNCPKCNLELQYFQSQAADAGTDRFEGWLPKEVGPYRIRAFVAQGGMGIVLRGLHKDTDLPAAVKLLRMDSDADPSWKQRFMTEIDTLKAMKHPNVVRLQDNGQDDKLMWLAMDWVDGLPMTKWAMKFRQEGNLIPLDQIKEVITQIAQGLVYLHQKQIIHRDLKPSNFLQMPDGLVKMVDFGIARNTSGQTAAVTQLTHTGMVAGTESYMSPEQADGQPLTPASDIYSFAVIWYELLTGKRPVGQFVPPAAIRPDCPASWNGTISQCLVSDPRARPTLDSILRVLSGMGAEPPMMTGMAPLRVGPPPMTTANVPPLMTGVAAPPAWQTPQGAVPPAYPPQPGYAQQPPTYAGQPGYPQSPAAPAGSGFGAKASAAAGSAANAVKAYLTRHPPRQQAKMAVAWMQTHVKQTIVIGAITLVVLVIIFIRGCSGSSNSSGGGGDTGNRDGKQDAKQPQKTPDQLFQEGMALVNSRDPAQQARGFDMVRQAGNAGSLPAMQNLYGYYLQIGDQQNTAYWMAKAAKAGDFYAQQFCRQWGIPF